MDEKKRVEYVYVKSFLSLLRNDLRISVYDIECTECPPDVIKEDKRWWK